MTLTAIVAWRMLPQLSSDSEFPKMADIARQLLCVPTTSTSSEHFFSTMPRAISKSEKKIL